MNRAPSPAETTRVVPADLDGARVDRAAARLFGFATAVARRLCADGRVRVDDRRAAAGDRVRAGQRLRATAAAAGWFVATGPVTALHVDDDVVVIDKPAGMPCHPLVPGEGGTVADAVVAAFPEVATAGVQPREGGLLHRLDNATSGCLAFARHRRAFDDLARSMRDDAASTETTKTYLAIVHGRVASGFVIDGAVDHEPGHPERMRLVDEGGRGARTVVTPRGSTETHSVVELSLHGGRRHQLRVHLAARGHPLVGDVLYGAVRPAPPAASTFLLHAWRLGLPGRAVVQAPLPRPFLAALTAYRLPWSSPS
jgi:23S rRNA pseudouridine1911/1915/1917 synthase